MSSNANRDETMSLTPSLTTPAPPSRPTLPSLSELIGRANDLVPTIERRAAAAEHDRMISAETMQEIHAAGLLRYFQPARFGGYEMDWGAQVQIGRALARGCASTSWLVCVVGSHSAYVARMSPEAQEDVWADGQDALIATGSVSRNVTIEAVNGGYVLSGRWSFCSGVDHAGWILLRGTPAGDSRQHYFLFPSTEFTIEDDWHVSGMCGTGSKSVIAKDVFIPEHRTLSLTALMSPNPPGAQINKNYVYNYNFRPFAGTALLGPILGAAEAAFAQYTAMIEERAAGGRLDIHDMQTQLRLAESSAELGAATVLLESLVQRQQHYAKADLDIPKVERIALVRDRTFTARLCFNAVERLMSHLDATEIYLEHPIQRHFRDLSGMVQQIGVNWDRNMTNCAKAMFGIEADIPYFNVE